MSASENLPDGARIALRNDDQGRLHYYLFEGSEAKIGRDPSGSQIWANYPNLSRQHARIFLDEGHGWSIEDFSRYGTFINGVRVQGKVVLPMGAEIQCGGLKLTVVPFSEAPPKNSADTKAD